MTLETFAKIGSWISQMNMGETTRQQMIDLHFRIANSRNAVRRPVELIYHC